MVPRAGALHATAEAQKSQRHLANIPLKADGIAEPQVKREKYTPPATRPV